MMRTTITLPDDVYELARDHAHARRISLGDALAELVRRAERTPLRIVEDGLFPHFDTQPDAPKITLAETLALEEETELEYDLHKAGQVAPRR